MSLSTFIQKIQNAEKVAFNDSITVITENYTYHPTEFSNGVPEDTLINECGVNEGSCKIFAFAKLQQLNRVQTLSLFGDYYWIDVIGNPEGSDHKNIRNFIKYGWQGINFKGIALVAK
ncbi:MAG: HopJ type III effector protein [Methylococcaceae bacterium]|nr:HopJ type III effector protein [Methylococcaceae bacterium]